MNCQQTVAIPALHMANDSIGKETNESIETTQIHASTNEEVEHYDANSSIEDSSGVNPVIIWVWNTTTSGIWLVCQS